MSPLPFFPFVNDSLAAPCSVAVVGMPALALSFLATARRASSMADLPRHFDPRLRRYVHDSWNDLEFGSVGGLHKGDSIYSDMWTPIFSQRVDKSA